MAAGGKGHAIRPRDVSDEAWEGNYCDTFGHHYRRGRCRDCGESELQGHGREVQATGSNPVNVGSIPTAPAIYVDAETGA